eukprot:12415425-Karenia_brevis.AAC.1
MCDVSDNCPAGQTHHSARDGSPGLNQKFKLESRSKIYKSSNQNQHPLGSGVMLTPRAQERTSTALRTL